MVRAQKDGNYPVGGILMLHPRHACNFHTIDVRVYSVIFHSFTYPFSHNHGSVENHPKNERKLILEIH